MFKVDMSLDAFPVSAGMRELEKKHIPFVMARIATLLPQRVKKGTITVMQKRLDRPIPTTLNSLFVKMATKARAAEVYFKDSWASGIPADTYLQQAVSGGLARLGRYVVDEVELSGPPDTFVIRGKATPGAVGVVHVARRAQIDPAHAQRIVAITDDGDHAVIAQRAGQAYVRSITR